MDKILAETEPRHPTNKTQMEACRRCCQETSEELNRLLAILPIESDVIFVNKMTAITRLWWEHSNDTSKE